MHRARATAARVAQDAAENRRPKLILPRAKTTAVVQDANVSLPAGWCARFGLCVCVKCFSLSMLVCGVVVYLFEKQVDFDSKRSQSGCLHLCNRSWKLMHQSATEILFPFVFFEG
ncbi:hypothetical protein T12_12127 [Trichinella patagoniensis]|uniref:Transmembrane protein n=1 Tax=Trichinella patagoniensis TaxID=990121 RepID=A0A0V1ACC5_9BILA|nr:hypothetical protein T12_12127 [Trichinella patagoniensis]